MRTSLQGWFPIGIRGATSAIVLKTLSVGTSAYLSEPPYRLHATERDNIGVRGVIRNSETKFLATAVINGARKINCRHLNLAAEDLHPVKPVRGGLAYQDSFLLAGFLMQPDDSVETPICYVHPLFMDGNGKRMSYQSGVHRTHIRAVQVRVLYVI